MHNQADIHFYEMRSSLRGDYFLKRSRYIDIQKNLFLRIGVKVWNNLINLVKCARYQVPASKMMFMYPPPKTTCIMHYNKTETETVRK